MQLFGKGLIISSLLLASSGMATDYYWLTPTSQIWHSSVFPNTATPTWSDESGTITLGPPDSASADAYIIAAGSPYLVTVASNFLVHSLTLEAEGGGLIASGRTITAGDIYANAGSLSFYDTTLIGNLHANGAAVTLSNLTINGAINSMVGSGVTLTGATTGIGSGLVVNSTVGPVILAGTLSGLYASSTGEGLRTTGTVSFYNVTSNGRVNILGVLYGQGGPNLFNGEVALSGGTLFNDTVAMTISASGVVHGYGFVGSNYPDRPVRFMGGKLSADVNGQALSPYHGYVAMDGGILEAKNGGILQFGGAQITGEGSGYTVDSVGGNVIASGTYFSGLYAGSTGEGFQTSGNCFLYGSTMNGRMKVAGVLYGQGAVNTIGGEIALAGGNLFNDTVAMTVGTTGLVHGFGFIGSNYNDRPVRFVGGKLSADVNGETLTHNYGYVAGDGAVLEGKNGGILALSAGQLTGEGAGFTVNSTTGIVRASGEYISGLYAGSTGEGIRVTADSSLYDATVNGRMNITNGVLWGRGSANVVGGEINISGTGNFFNDTGTMTVGATGLVHGFGLIGTNYADRPIRFVGSKLSADVNAQTLNHYYGYLAGDGAVLEGKNGGILALSAGQLTGEGAGFTVNSTTGIVRASGEYISGLYAGSTGEGIRVTANSFLNDATVNGRVNITGGVLSGRGSANVIGGEININGDGNLLNDTGTLRVTANGIVHGAGLIGSNYGDRPLHIQGGLLSADVSGQTLNHYYGYLLLEGGTISSESGGTMAMNASFNLISGTLKSNSAFTFATPYTLPAGQMTGSGSFTTTTLTNAGGTVNPGDPIGSLTLNGNYIQQPGGTLRIDIDGYAPGQSDRFVVNGTASLGGELTVFPTGGFVPQFGDRFRILTANSRTNRFDTIPATQWQMAYGPNFVDIIYIVSNNAVSYPLSMDVIEGDLFDGSVTDLGVSDDGYVKILCDSTTLLSRVEFTGVAPIATFSKLWFLAETSVVRPGIAEATLLYDYTLGRFVEIGGGLAATDDSLSLRSVVVNPMRFKGPGNQVRAQIAWSPINDEDPSQDGWLHYLDLVRWEAAP